MYGAAAINIVMWILWPVRCWHILC